MDATLDAAIKGLPDPVPWSDVAQIESFDERRALIEPRTHNIVGVVEAGVEFCPNDDPPARTELLAFLWLVRPNLTPLIYAELTDLAVREVVKLFACRVSDPDER